MDVIALVGGRLSAPPLRRWAPPSRRTSAEADVAHRMPEPVIALDGDTAGLRAAMRADRHRRCRCWRPGRSLRFCDACPRGSGPRRPAEDRKAAQAMQELLDQGGGADDLSCSGSARPRAGCLTAPSASAALDRQLLRTVMQARSVTRRSARHYGEELRRSCGQELFGYGDAAPVPQRDGWQGNGWQGSGKGRKGRFGAPAMALESTSQLVTARGAPIRPSELVLAEAMILATLITHRRPDPALRESICHALEELHFIGDWHDRDPRCCCWAVTRKPQRPIFPKPRSPRRSGRRLLKSLSWTLAMCTSGPLRPDDSDDDRPSSAMSYRTKQLAKIAALRAARRSEIEEATARELAEDASADMGGPAGLTRCGAKPRKSARHGKTEENDRAEYRYSRAQWRAHGSPRMRSTPFSHD